MRTLKLLIAVLVIGVMLLVSISCAGGGATPSPTPQVITVRRGNIAVNVTGTGNLALETKQALSFGQTGIATQASTAKISEVDVVAGQTVKQGQVLVKADPTDYQNQLVIDQHNLDSALTGVAQAQTAVAQAQVNAAQAQVTLLQDQASLVKAQQTLNSQSDVQALQEKIDNANIQLQQAKLNLSQALAVSNSSDIQYWNSQITYLSVNTNPSSSAADGGLIGTLQKQMSRLLTDPNNAGAVSITSGANGSSQIQANVLAVQQAQAKIVTDQANLVLAPASVTNAQNNVIIAQNKVTDAQTTLNNDKNSAQEIDAPFEGLITNVTVTQGSIVQRNATLIEIAVPDKFVANILVTEHDVLSLKLGANAIVSLNALTGYAFPAKITQIAPLATIQQGVVNYQVTIELSSTTPQSTAARPSPSTSGAFPSGTTAVRSPSPSASPAVSLKDGLSVLVTIPIQSRLNVLILPSRALTRSGQNYTVQKIVGTSVETVDVQVGLTDGTNTEIISGLNEGDEVLQKTVTSATSGPGFGGPGGGGVRIP
jgi:HlyD family secretion protein